MPAHRADRTRPSRCYPSDVSRCAQVANPPNYQAEQCCALLAASGHCRTWDGPTTLRIPNPTRKTTRRDVPRTPAGLSKRSNKEITSYDRNPNRRPV